MATQHFRSAAVEADGRNLHGVAVPFGKPAHVTDDGGRSFYRESFNGRAFTKTLRDKGDGVWPLMYGHPFQPGSRASTVPFGAVRFRSEQSGLTFEARVSKTRDGDEALELINDRVIGDVSLHFRSFRDRHAKDAVGAYVERMEAGIVEMSLAIVGHGQHPGAEVLAVRSAVPDGTPRLDALRRRKSLLTLTF